MSSGNGPFPGQERNRSESSATTTSDNNERTAYLRRREAALRCEPLADGRRDPDLERALRPLRGPICWDCAALDLSERTRLVDCTAICPLAARTA